jgi:ribonuclease BN (tRNA processing enzyme)
VGGTTVRFLGTGNAFHLSGRGSQCIWIEPETDSPFLVDAGPTAMSGMLRHDLDPQAIDRLFVTHLHGDHIAGWPFLLLHLIILGRRTRPFDLIGPVGVRERLESLARLCFEEAAAKREFEIRYHELPVEKRTGVAVGRDMTLDLLPLQHHPSSIGLRFHLDGRRIGVSGDTGWCRNLETLAAQSDLAILECTTAAPESKGHLSLDEIRAGRERLGPGEVVLVHLSDDVAEELAVNPIAGVIAAYDGMIWSPPDLGPKSP